MRVMNSQLKSQLNRLLTTTAHSDIDNLIDSDSLESLSSVVFYKRNSSSKEIKVIFEDYIVHPYAGFDLHDKFNNGISPPTRTMYGKIEKETEKMYKLNVHTDTLTDSWVGWCPKKSCIIKST